MNARRLALSLVLLLSTGLARAQEKLPVVVKLIERTLANDVGQEIRLPRGAVQLEVSTYEIAPGARLPVHKHPWQRYGYVIEGDLRVEQIGRGSRVYHAGELVAESVNRWHFGENVGTGPLRLLVIDQTPPKRAATIVRK